MSTEPTHEEQLFALTQSYYCKICRSYGNYIAIIIVVSVSLGNILNSPMFIPTVLATMPLLSQRIVVMRCGMICLIVIYPGIISA